MGRVTDANSFTARKPIDMSHDAQKNNRVKEIDAIEQRAKQNYPACKDTGALVAAVLVSMMSLLIVLARMAADYVYRD